MSENTKFSNAINIIRELIDKKWNDRRTVIGTITVSERNVSRLEHLALEDCLVEAYINDKSELSNLHNKIAKAVGKKIQITIDARRCGNIFKTFNNFLDHSTNKYKKPDNPFFIVEENTGSTLNPSPRIKAYYDAISLANLLHTLSDIPNILNSDPGYSFFSGVMKIEIPVQYSSADLSHPLEGLAELRKELLSTIHFDEKKEIFKSTIIDSVGPEPDIEKRFSSLLCRFESIAENYRDAYKVYVHKFSIKEVKDEIESNKIELAEKIHSVMSDLNRNMLSIPLGFIFVAPRIKSDDISSVNNTIILVCAWIFGLFVFFSLRSYKHTLKFISNEVFRQKNKIESDYPKLKEQLLPPYIELENRVAFQVKTRRCVQAGLIIVLIAITILYSYHSG